MRKTELFSCNIGIPSGKVLSACIVLALLTLMISALVIVGAVKAPAQQSTQSTWYLAEGSTAWGFFTSIQIENPNSEDVTAKVTYMTAEGEVARPDITLPAMSQTTLRPGDYDLRNTDFSTKVECKEGKIIAVDRTMSWHLGGYGNVAGHHNSIGVNSPNTTWYLPEGSSAWGFETWLLIQNPNQQEATCQVTYMIEGVGPQTFEKRVPAQSRATYNMAEDVGEQDASIKVESNLPVITERSMYILAQRGDTEGRHGGSDSIGATTAAKDYYLAEGSTGWGFTTYILIQNPNKTEAEVTITYMTNTGQVSDEPFKLPAEGRKTICVNDTHPNMDLSTWVHADKPIVAERAMYWRAASQAPLGMHDSIGMTGPHKKFYLPDGETFFEPELENFLIETFTLVQNPNDSHVQVRISYLTDTGEWNAVFTDMLLPNSRRTYNMASVLGTAGTRAAIMVECLSPGKKIMVERSMYFNQRWSGTNSIGGYSD